tara:strand:+ start:217 stop:384 length:168 start_codon:yes stop_codon:yes gene_type:complete
MSKLAHSNDEFMRILEELDYMGKSEMLEQAQVYCRDETTSTPDFFDGYKNLGDAT